jgi:hypothetical protein
MSRDEAAARLHVVNDLTMLALSMHNYHGEENHKFPPADGSLDPKEPKLTGLSWRAYLLKLMDSDTNPVREQQVYYNLLDGKYPPDPGAPPSEAWNRPDLKTLALSPFKSPFEVKTKDAWDTYYRVFIGNGAAFEAKKQLSLQTDFPDGAANTILIVEAGDAVPWPKPQELEYDPNKPLPKLGGHFADGFYAAFADATVRFIPTDTDEKLIRAMITRNGGEKIETLPAKVDSEALRKVAGLK